MIVLLSPSKTQDFESPAPKAKHSTPDLLQESEVLINALRKLSAKKIGTLMDVSEKIATLNHARYAAFTTPFTSANARQAAFAFKGDVYDGLMAETLPPKALTFAQDHLRILSGLYGVLRPLDLIQPYRLEMSIKLKNPRGADLYRFWGDRLSKLLNESVEEVKASAVVNLASEEYAKAVHAPKLIAPVITPQFKEKKGNAYQVIGLFAKKARGAMARNIMMNGLTDPSDLKHHAPEGYRYNAALSTDVNPVFTRDLSVASSGRV